jgi:hypothetical protein
MWRGAKTGCRRVSYVTVPLAAILVMVGIALTAFGMGSGRGFGVHPMVPRGFAFALSFAVFGALCGAGFALIGPAIRHAMPEAVASWWERANRPVRLRKARESRSTDSGWRWVLLLGVPVLLIWALAFSAGVRLGHVVEQQLAAATAAAHHDDPFWRVDDLIAHREPVPVSENSALVLADALAQVPANWPNDPANPGGPPVPASEVGAAYARLDSTPDNV